MITVFISIPWFRPAFRAGGPIQSIDNLVNEFQENINYKIFCGNTDLNNTILEDIETNKWVTYNSCTEIWYASSNDRSHTILKLVEEIKPDVLFIIGIFSWHFNIVPLLFCKATRKIVSVRGMLHPGALSQKPEKKKIYLSLFKIMGLANKTLFHATNNAEKKIITDLLGEKAKVFVAGNIPHKIPAQQDIRKEKGKLNLVSVALISPMKNHLLILEALMNCFSQIEYHICGPVKDMEYWQLCLNQQKKMPGNVKIIYHNDVNPKLVADYLYHAHVFILPSKSENFGHAFYEALSAGKPVITSYNTPWNGLEAAKAGLNIQTEPSFISNAIEQFAAMEDEEYGQWKAGAIKYSNEVIDIESIKEQYRVLFKS